jgi:TatA/E family protein of Tat protein translocase
MPFRLGLPELAILLAAVVLIFGVGRLGRLGAELGQAIRLFRRNLDGPETPATGDGD